MFLKCPICGDKYSYDRKICQRCENQSIISDLTSVGINKSQKWNCGIFLNTSKNPFGKSFKSYVKIASESKIFNFNRREDNDWNCDDARKFNRVITSNFTSNAETDTVIAINGLNSQKRDNGSLLIYE